MLSRRSFVVVSLGLLLAALPFHPAAAACHVASFVGDPYTVDESDGSVRITVSNNGGQGVGSIDYKTVNGTAKAGQDYESKSGTLAFAPPTGELSFDVVIKDDNKNEPTETFRIQLSNPQGCFTTVSEQDAIVSIKDGQITQPTPTPTPTPTKTATKKPSPKPSTASASPSPSDSPTASTSATPTTAESPLAQAGDDDGTSSGLVVAIVALTLVFGGIAAFWVRRRFLT